MVTVQEFNALSPSQQQQTIQDLMSSDPQNAQFLMYYQAEQAGVNIKTPATSTNPTQAAQIKEAQSYNQQVYEESQAAKAESIIVNAPLQTPSSVTPLQALTTVAANTSDRAVLNEAKEAFYPTDKAVADITFNPVDQTLTASYVPKVIAPAPPPAKNDFNIFSAGQNNLFSNVLTGIQDPFSIGKKSFLTNVADYKGDSTQFFVKQSIKIGGLVSLGVAPAVAVGGALVSTGLSQGIKALQGEGALTSKEVQDAFYGGAAFSVIGGSTIKALGLTGSGVKMAAGRVGVNALLGAGAGGVYEYAETKQVTLEGLGTGAAFGAGFGLAGEAFSVGRVKASQKLQDNLMGSLNKAVESNTVWKPSASDKATMLLLRKVPNIQQSSQKVSQIKFVNEPSGLAAGKFKELDYIKTINREIAPTKVNSDTVFESSSTIKPGLFRELDYTRSIDKELFQDWRKTVKPYYDSKPKTQVQPKIFTETVVSSGRKDYFVGAGKTSVVPEMKLQTRTKAKRVSKQFKTFDVEGQRQVNDLLNRGLFREAELVSANRLGIELDTKEYQLAKQQGKGTANNSVKRIIDVNSGKRRVGGFVVSNRGGTQQKPNTLIDTGKSVVPVPFSQFKPKSNPDPVISNLNKVYPGTNIKVNTSTVPRDSIIPANSIVPFNETVSIFKTQSQTKTKPRYRLPVKLPNLGGSGGNRGGGSSWGRWYYRKHPIPSAVQQIKQLSGGKIQKVKLRKTKSKRKRGSKR